MAQRMIARVIPTADVDRAGPRPAAQLLNHLPRRMRLEDFPHSALPADDRRTKISSFKALLVLLRNLLISREPIDGMGEWAAHHVPNLLGLRPYGSSPSTLHVRVLPVQA